MQKKSKAKMTTKVKKTAKVKAVKKQNSSSTKYKIENLKDYDARKEEEPREEIEERKENKPLANAHIKQIEHALKLDEKIKSHLSAQQEFDLVKSVIDKFLFVPVAIIVFGLYHLSFKDIITGVTWILIGGILLAVFVVLVKKKFEIR